MRPFGDGLLQRSVPLVVVDPQRSYNWTTCNPLGYFSSPCGEAHFLIPRPTRLFDFPVSGNGYEIRLALAHLGLTVDYEEVDLLCGENVRPEFLDKNPMGQIPVLELEDGTFLRESNAILYWLTEETPLMPTDRLGRTRVVQWFSFEQSNIDKVLGRTRLLKRYPAFMPATEADWEGWYATGYRALDVVERTLRESQFLLGRAPLRSLA